MDGNGRWAEARGLSRIAGHRAGAEAVRRVVRAAREAGIGTLTLFAFSSDNWRRPAPEVRGILSLLASFLRTEASACREKGIRLSVIGRRDRLPRGLVRAIERAEEATREGRALRLRIAVDYSGRDAILLAASRLPPAAAPSRDDFARGLSTDAGAAGPAPDVDLFVRPGGERRLSDFLLWESAYAELVFSDRLWPDFDGEDFSAALADFASRDRRFGRITEASRTLSTRNDFARNHVRAPGPLRA